MFAASTRMPAVNPWRAKKGMVPFPKTVSPIWASTDLAATTSWVTRTSIIRARRVIPRNIVMAMPPMIAKVSAAFLD